MFTLLGSVAAGVSAAEQSSSCDVVFLRMDAPDGWYAVAPDGSGLRRLRYMPEAALWAAWAPDGRVVTDSAGGMVALDPKGRRLRRFPLDVLVRRSADSVVWSRDGKEIAFSSRLGHGPTRISVVRVDGTALRRIMIRSGKYHFASWSSDGSRILLTRDLKPSNSAIYVMNSDGTHVTRVRLPFTSAGEPDLAPDGKRIVFAVGYNGHDKPGIYAANIDGTGIHRLTDNLGDEFPLWSPDGTKIAFTRAGGGDPPSEADVMNPNGSQLRTIAHSDSQSEWDLGVNTQAWICATVPGSRQR
jgi:TolB protein